MAALFRLAWAYARQEGRGISQQENRPRAEARENHRQEFDRHEYNELNRIADETVLNRETGTKTDTDKLKNALDSTGDSSENDEGNLEYGGKEASLEGTGGVALIEHEKDQMQTAVSNITSVGQQEKSSKKTAQRKMDP